LNESRQSFDTIPAIRIKDGMYKHLSKDKLEECVKSLELESSSDDEIDRLINAPEEGFVSMRSAFKKRLEEGF